MKRTGPDSLNSWIISFACCFINMMMYGMVRLSGVLFVASIPRFNVNRERASFPYTFASFMRNASGPLVGYLGHKFGVRAVTTLGCVLGSLGIGLCYFAENISIVTLLWGAVFGLGFGLGNVLLPVSINQHFDKHRATASGISFSGACLGSFILPPVVDVLLNTYGLSGTYLFLSAFVLNCVPAALLLKKPNYDLKTPKPLDDENGEKQSLTSGMKVKLYTEEIGSNISNICPQDSIEINIATRPEGNKEDYSEVLSNDEKMKHLSTQTLLCDYSIRMSTSEPLDVDQTIENCTERRKVDPNVLEAENLSLSSHNTANSEKNGVFEKDFRSSSVKYDKPALPSNKIRASSSEDVSSDHGKYSFAEPNKGYYQNYAYQIDAEELPFKNDLSKNSNFFHRNIDPSSSDNSQVYFSPYQKHSDSFKCLPNQVKKSFENKTNDSRKTFECSDTDNENVCVTYQTFPDLPKKDVCKSTEKSMFGVFSVIFEPMFILIAVTNAIYCFTFVCMITVIVDFARDLEIGTSNEKYVLMTLSIGDIAGRLGLGWITDGGYMKTTAFIALCFAFQGVTIAAIAWSDGFITLIVLISLFGFSEAGIITIFPVIIAQYIDHDKQTVAIPSSNFLSGPLCLAIAPLIGYFRDDIGAYDYIFYGLAILSAACSFTWMLAPYIAKCRNRS